MPEIAGVLAGYRSALQPQNPDQGIPLVHNVYQWMVHPIGQHRGVGRQMFEGLKRLLNEVIRTIKVMAWDPELAFFLLRMGCEGRASNIAYNSEDGTENQAEYEFIYPPGSSPTMRRMRAFDFRLMCRRSGRSDPGAFEDVGRSAIRTATEA